MDCTAEIVDMNLCFDIQPLFSTNSFSIRGIIAKPPPKVKSPILKQLANMAHNKLICFDSCPFSCLCNLLFLPVNISLYFYITYMCVCHYMVLKQKGHFT